MQKKDIIFLITGLLISLFLATFISPLASSDPDGLEKVAEENGFSESSETDHAWESAPVADYEISWVKNKYFKTGLAGFVGTATIFLVGFVFARVLGGKKRKLSKGGTG